MILVTRFNGAELAVNSDLIQRVEATPDTVITLTDGSKFVVVESVDEVIQRVRLFRASVLAAVDELHGSASRGPSLHLVTPDDGGSGS